MMNKQISPEIKELIDVVNYRPAVSVIMPFDPKMWSETAIAHSLKMVSNKVERQLRDQFPEELVEVVMNKLKHSIENLNYNTHKKSIAIYVSPLFEKTLYLEIPVEEKIVIDESFEIRDLVYCKKEIHKYLVLLLSSKGSKIFLGNTDSFVTLVSNGVDTIDDYDNDAPEQVANFSDKSSRKEMLMDKYLLHIDRTLDIILKAYQLPLFVLGTERIAGHFNNMTRHSASVLEYVPGNYEDTPLPEIREILEPYIADWKKVKQKDLLRQLELAAGNKKLAKGIDEAWKAAFDKNVRLLVVEKNYTYAATHSSDCSKIMTATGAESNISIISDAVDDIIEKVLENGGDVSFTDENVLADYQHIAVVKWH